MLLNKRQLRQLIKEACGLETGMPQMLPDQAGMEPTPDVPVPEDYAAVRDLLDSRADYVNMAIAHVMDMAGTQCERSTAQAIIDHLQDMVSGSQAPVEEPLPALPMSGMEMIKGPGFM